MVPFWTIPIALVMGNTIVVKPSEKVPLTLHRVATLLAEAGLPPGCFNLVHGSRTTAEALLQHPIVQAVTFVGSSPVAESVSLQCRQLHKRCTALGGAKNHLVVLPDCSLAETVRDVCVSFAGCAGQRCMAASVLLLVGSLQQSSQVPTEPQQYYEDLLSKLVTTAAQIQPGTEPGQMGPVIDTVAHQRIVQYITAAEHAGAKVLLDGRLWMEDNNNKHGNWIGPTILVHPSAQHRAVREEVFGPVLSVVMCTTWEDAIAIENASPFGNAACVYTNNGGSAEWFTERFRAAMLGVNIGIPVPREPFSFGGLYGTCSKYGDMDITGDGAMEFFSHRVKISTKWPTPEPSTAADIAIQNGDNVISSTVREDRANFAGSM